MYLERNQSNDNPQKTYLSDFIKIKMKEVYKEKFFDNKKTG